VGQSPLLITCDAGRHVPACRPVADPSGRPLEGRSDCRPGRDL